MKNILLICIILASAPAGSQDLSEYIKKYEAKRNSLVSLYSDLEKYTNTIKENLDVVDKKVAELDTKIDQNDRSIDAIKGDAAARKKFFDENKVVDMNLNTMQITTQVAKLFSDVVDYNNTNLKVASDKFHEEFFEAKKIRNMIEGASKVSLAEINKTTSQINIYVKKEAELSKKAEQALATFDEKNKYNYQQREYCKKQNKYFAKLYNDMQQTNPNSTSTLDIPNPVSDEDFELAKNRFKSSRTSYKEATRTKVKVESADDDER